MSENLILDVFNGIAKKDRSTIVVPAYHLKPLKRLKKGVFNIIKYIEPEFQLTDDVRDVLNLLFRYFHGMPTFKSAYRKLYGKETNPSLNKGIFIVGNVGTGKTLMFDAFQKYTSEVLKKNSFSFYTAAEIVDNVDLNGIEALAKFYPSENAKGRKVYIDDIAAQPETVNHFGTTIEVMNRLLSIRYNAYKRYGLLTHVSSNKYPSELSGVYDKRIVDRFAEMFNIIELTGDSFRK